MPSRLSLHLRECADHGELGMHPGCPICRDERVAGSLPSTSVVPRRAGAYLAAGALVLPAMVPAGAVATEPDQDIVGSASPDQVTTDGIDMDPGGESESLPPAPPTDPSQLGPDAGPVAATPEPAADPDTDPTVTEADLGDQDASEPVTAANHRRSRSRPRRSPEAHASTAPGAGDDRRSAPANLDSAATAASRAEQARGCTTGQPSARRAGAGAGAAGRRSRHDGALASSLAPNRR